MSYKKKLGFIHIFLAAVAEGVFGLFVQLIEELEPEDVIGLNNVLRLLFLMPIIIYSKTPLLFDIKTMLLIALRSIFSAGSMCLLTYSYTLLPIGDAAAIYYCNPPLTMLLSMCFLRSKCQVLEILAGFSCFLGELLICNPTFIFPDQSNNATINTTSRYLGIVLALIAAIFESLAFFLTHFFPHPHFSVLPFYSVLIVLFTWIITVIHRGCVPILWKCSNSSVYLVIVGMLGIFIMINVNLGFRVVQPGTGSIIFSAGIPISYLAQVFIMEDFGEVKSYFGSVLVLFSIILINVRDFTFSFSLLVRHISSCSLIVKRCPPNYFANRLRWKYSSVEEGTCDDEDKDSFIVSVKET